MTFNFLLYLWRDRAKSLTTAGSFEKLDYGVIILFQTFLIWCNVTLQMLQKGQNCNI